MNRLHPVIAASTIVLSTIVALPSEGAEAPESGSPAAAASVAADFVALIYSVPQERIDVGQPEINGEWAKVHVRGNDKTCELTMRREPASNAKGWVVTLHSCQ